MKNILRTSLFLAAFMTTSASFAETRDCGCMQDDTMPTTCDQSQCQCPQTCECRQHHS